jgi:hypothetical protein
VVPVGQGHTEFGRWGSGQGVNPLVTLDPSVDADAGAPSFAAPLTSLKKAAAT